MYKINQEHDYFLSMLFSLFPPFYFLSHLYTRCATHYMLLTLMLLYMQDVPLYVVYITVILYVRCATTVFLHQNYFICKM